MTPKVLFLIYFYEDKLHFLWGQVLFYCDTIRTSLGHYCDIIVTKYHILLGQIVTPLGQN